MDAAEQVDGVALASPTRFTQANVAGKKGAYQTLVDPKTVNSVYSLDWKDGEDSLLSGLGPTDAVIDEKWGREKGFGVGDTFTAGTASGRKIKYTVRGTFFDDADFNGDYVASDVNAADYGEETTATQVLVKLDDGADAGAVKDELNTVVSDRFPTVEAKSQQEFKDFIGEEVNQLLGVVYALLALAVIVSLFGIVNTLALSIYERTRELGLMRAVGMSRRQVRRIVRYESVITALIGAVLGSLLGASFAVDHEPAAGRRGLHALDSGGHVAGAAGARRAGGRGGRHRPGAARLAARRARSARLRVGAQGPHSSSDRGSSCAAPCSPPSPC